MASNVANALGTERQFSSQPQDVYARKLYDLPKVAVETPTDSSGIRLAQSLGVLANTIGDYANDAEKRDEKLNTFEAEKFAKGQTEEDLHKYSAIELLNNKGRYDLSNNKWAIATVERMRGQYFSAKADAEYSQLVADKGYDLTPDKEAQRYEQFKQQKFSDFSKNQSNPDAFGIGFWDNHQISMLSKVKDQINFKNKERASIRDGSFEAQVGQIADNSLHLSDQEIFDQLQTLFRSTGIAGAGRDQKMAWGLGVAKAIAQGSWSPDKVAKLKDLEIYVDDNGNPVKLGDVVDLTEPLHQARVFADQNNVNAVLEKRLELSKLPSSKIFGAFDELAQSDESMYKILAHYKDTMYQNALTREAQEEKKRLKGLADMTTKKNVGAILEAQWGAWMANLNTDGRYPTAHSLGSLPDVDYVDADGNYKKRKPTDEEVYDFAKSKMMSLYANPNVPMEDKAKTMMRMIAFPPAANYAQALKGTITSSLDTASTNQMIQNMDLGGVQSALEMYQADAGTFKQVFGADVTGQVETIRALMSLEGSKEGAMDKFVLGRNALRDPATRDIISSQFKQFAPIGTSAETSSMGGGSNSISVSDPTVAKPFEVMVTHLMGAGYSPQNAIEIAKGKIKENYWEYNNYAFPKAWFGGLNVEDKGATASAFLDKEKADFVTNNGLWSADGVFAHYDPVTDSITIMGNGTGRATYSRKQFTEQANEFAIASMEGKVPEQIQQYRDKERWDQNNSDTGSFFPTDIIPR